MTMNPLPCPFCGASIPSQRLRDGSKYGSYECGECGAQGPDVRTGYGREEEWRDKATAAWNGRSSVDRNLLGELYQVLGALDVGAKVLDQVSAAINGQPLPHQTLLPYAEKPSIAHAEAKLSAKAARIGFLDRSFKRLTKRHEATQLDLGEALILIGQVIECRTFEDLTPIRRYLNEFMDRYSARPCVRADQGGSQHTSATEAIDSLTLPLCVVSLHGDERQKALANSIAGLVLSYQRSEQDGPQ